MAEDAPVQIAVQISPDFHFPSRDLEQEDLTFAMLVPARSLDKLTRSVHQSNENRDLARPLTDCNVTLHTPVLYSIHEH